MADVRDNPERSRFELEREGALAKLDYRVEGARLVLVHTEVPEAFQGEGMGGRLVRAALDRARAGGLTVVPECPYARTWIDEHPDETGGITVERGAT